MSELLEKLKKRRATLIVYLQSKVDEMEWHGVADAAMDLREVDAKLEVLRNVPENQIF